MTTAIQMSTFFSKRQAIRYVFLNAFLIFAAYFIWFKVWWTKGSESNLGILSFIVVAISLFFLSMSLTRLFIPNEIEFGFSTFGSSKKENYTRFAEKIGPKKANHIMNIWILIYIFFAIIPAYIFYTQLNLYELTQLTNYGETQSVMVKEIEGGKSGPYVAFDFYIDGKKYSDHLKMGDKNVNQGDQILVIFSKKNPDIIKYLDDYLAKLNERN